MSKVATPTLGQQFLLTRPSDQIAYQLNMFAATPKAVTENFTPLTASLQEIMSKKGYNKDDIIAPVKTALLDVFSRIFGSGLATVEVTTQAIDEIRYNLVMQVVAFVDGQSYTVASSIATTADGRLDYQSLTINR